MKKRVKNQPINHQTNEPSKQSTIKTINHQTNQPNYNSSYLSCLVLIYQYLTSHLYIFFCDIPSDNLTLLLPTQTHENPESKVTAASGNTLIQCDVYRYVYLLIFKNIYLPLHASISSLSHTLLSSNLLDLLPPSLPPSPLLSSTIQCSDG